MMSLLVELAVQSYVKDANIFLIDLKTFIT